MDDDDTLTFEGRTVEQLEDMDVARDGQKIGEIDEVLADPTGQIVAVVIDFEDDFLDDREVILAIDQLKFGDDAARGHRHARRCRARGPPGLGRLTGRSPDAALDVWLRQLS